MKKIITRAITISVATAIVLSGCGIRRDILQDDETVVESSVVATTETLEEDVVEATVETSSAEEDSTEDADVEAETYIPPTTTPGEYDSPELMEGDKLSEEELKQLQEYFSRVDNYGFTLSSYKTPDEIDWYEVFNCEGAGIDNCEFSKEALYEFMDIKGYDHDSMYIASEDKYEGLSAISGKDVKAFVESKTGIKDFDPTELKYYTYIEREDVLFRFADPFIYDNEITCLEGVRNNGSVQVVIKFDDGSRFDRRITLVETGDTGNPYHFYSNRQLWEKDADEIVGVKDYETDEMLACSVNKESNGVILKPVRDSVVCGYAEALIDKTGLDTFNKVKEIALCDVNADGHKDTIAILKFGDDTVPVLCLGDYESWGVTYCAEAKSDVTEWLIDNVGDMKADNVISYISEHQDELKSIIDK